MVGPRNMCEHRWVTQIVTGCYSWLSRIGAQVRLPTITLSDSRLLVVQSWILARGVFTVRKEKKRKPPPPDTTNKCVGIRGAKERSSGAKFLVDLQVLYNERGILQAKVILNPCAKTCA